MKKVYPVSGSILIMVVLMAFYYYKAYPSKAVHAGLTNLDKEEQSKIYEEETEDYKLKSSSTLKVIKQDRSPSLSLEEKYRSLDTLIAKPIKELADRERITELLRDEAVRKDVFDTIKGNPEAPQTREHIAKRFSSLGTLYQMLQQEDHVILQEAEEFIELFIDDSTFETSGTSQYRKHVIGDKIEILKVLKKVNTPLFENLMLRLGQSDEKNHKYIVENFDRLSSILTP